MVMDMILAPVWRCRLVFLVSGRRLDGINVQLCWALHRRFWAVRSWDKQFLLTVVISGKAFGGLGKQVANSWRFALKAPAGVLSLV